MNNKALKSNCPCENPIAFDDCFSRSRKSLYVIALHILKEPEKAHNAVDICRSITFSKRPQFHTEGAFYSWLFRALIDEALSILIQDKDTCSITLVKK